jgi:hypothetical protein
MQLLETVICAAFVAISIPSVAAQPMSSNQFHSHSTQIPHYNPLKAVDRRNLPRSTAPVRLSVTASVKPASAHGSEIDRLEHQTVSQLQAESRHGVKPTNSAGRFSHSQTSSHGSAYAFSYRPPQGTSRSSASGGRRH